MIYSKETREKYLGFDDKYLMLVGVPILSILIQFLFSKPVFNFSDITSFTFEFLESLYFTSLHWLSTRFMIVELRKKFPDFEFAQKRIFIQFSLAFAGGIILGPVFHMIYHHLIGSFLNIISIHDHDEIKMPAVLLIILLMVAIYEVIYFYHQLKHSILEREAVKQAHIQSQWEGLRNQVNPHFLFNSMNTLMGIIDEDSILAKRFLKKLSKVYRYILESREDPLIPLDHEMEFIHSYVFLQQERFRGKLNVDFDISEQYGQYRIVPMSLQILFENAIKHNVISNKRPLSIEVFVQKNPDRLIIKNNLQLKTQVIDSTKLGLENLKKRYAFFTADQVQVEDTDGYFTVKIPLIHPDKNIVHEGFNN